jgi:hypothetical protein
MFETTEIWPVLATIVFILSAFYTVPAQSSLFGFQTNYFGNEGRGNNTRGIYYGYNF